MSKRWDRALFALAASIAVGCSAPSSERLGTSSAAAQTQFANDQTAYDYFRAKGFTTFQAAGIVGNLDQESGVDPTIAQYGGGPGRGIAQWSTGGRWDTSPGDNLLAFAMQEGLPSTSLTVQLDFIMFELQMFSGYGLAMLQASTNLTDATTDFELGFEGCADPTVCALPQRISYAMDVLNAYGNDPVSDAGGGTGDAGGTTTEAGPGTGDDGGTTTADTGAPGNPGGGYDASTPPGASPDAGARGDASNGGNGGAGAAGPWQGQGSGCAVAAAASRSDVSAAWLVALGGGLVAAVGRRRRRILP
jgi:hypothetical protein